VLFVKKIIVTSAGGGFTPKEEPVPEPGSRCARVKIQACGVCHSDALTKDGSLPGIVYPRAPGHEIAGVIDALGPDADPWNIGDRVGVG
ncbi:alcohol dehydrogenase catalytic domain-containing protein, partial [Salmonella sp. SAL04284]|uniref:alcohol dehydrogenase catalytic domain-containing protein n=1 Tax=Salmonella sp. SAL04284 TaxID=3159862 RepID=UPI00397A3CD7